MITSSLNRSRDKIPEAQSPIEQIIKMWWVFFIVKPI
jgi:hypothetical protein